MAVPSPLTSRHVRAAVGAWAVAITGTARTVPPGPQWDWHLSAGTEQRSLEAVVITEPIRIAAIDDHPACCPGVATHLKRIRARLGPANAAGLGRMAGELGVFDDPVTQPGQP